jgi:hypothetical protein
LNQTLLEKQAELVEHPPGASSAFSGKVVLIVASCNDGIDKVGYRTPRSGRNGYNMLTVPGYGVVPESNFHLPAVAVPRRLRSQHVARIHGDADCLLGVGLEVQDPVVSAGLEDGISNKVNIMDNAVWAANLPFVRDVTDGVISL